MKRSARYVVFVLLIEAVVLSGVRVAEGGSAAANGFFSSVCKFSHRLADDPIVAPGQPGASHMHDFFGSRVTDAFATVDSMRAGTTTCGRALETAGYWTPSLLRDGVELTPVDVQVYWVSRVAVPVLPPPEGLMIIAGDRHAESAQPLSLVQWRCGSGARSSTPPVCTGTEQLKLQIRFPDCWDGANLDSSDHVSHMAYSSGSACPDAHPVPLPSLRLTIRWKGVIGNEGLSLSSGSLYSGHADFLNAWDQAELARLVETCLNGRLACARKG